MSCFGENVSAITSCTVSHNELVLGVSKKRESSERVAVKYLKKRSWLLRIGNE